MAKQHGRAVKDDEQYEALRREGASKEKAARVANTKGAGKTGGHRSQYEDWTRDDLYAQAQKVDIEGRSRMSKGELIEALRHH